MSGYVCPECGLDYDTVSPSDAVVALRSYPRRFGALVRIFDDHEDPDALVRRRPEAGVWSALEYCAHVADVLAELAGVIRRMAVEDQPTIDMADPDEVAERSGYNRQSLDAVLDRLAAGAERMAAEIDRVPAGEWGRTATFSWGERDALTMMRNAVHEGTHHLRDVERVLAAVRGRPAAEPED